MREKYMSCWISWTYSLVVACRPNMTVMLVILWVFALLRCTLGWWWWWHDVHKLIILRQASCCSMYGGTFGYGLGWVMVHKFTWQWVGLGWIDENRPMDNSAIDRMMRRHTLCPKNVSDLMFDNNFNNCGPIFKILSPIRKKILYDTSPRFPTYLQHVVDTTAKCALLTP